MATPTMRPTSINGAGRRMSDTIASRATSSTSGPVIWPPCFLAPPLTPSPRRRGEVCSNRHLQDVLVGRDHLVAHGYERADGGFAFGDRGDDVDHVGLAQSHGLRLG